MRSLLLTGMILCIAAAQAGAAEVRVFPFPRVAGQDGPVLLGEVAEIEAPADIAAELGGLVLDPALYADGFLDKNDYMRALRNKVDGTICILGNGTRFFKPGAGSTVIPEGSVIAGAPVSFVVINRGVRIEIRGIAVEGGKVGDRIPVRLKNSRVREGKILSGTTVECGL